MCYRVGLHKSSSLQNFHFFFNNSTSSGLFNVVPGSGDVYVDAPLQGQMGIYQLVLSVHDQGSPPLFSNTSVYVTVEDVNDNQPQIITPAVNATYYIYEVNSELRIRWY